MKTINKLVIIISVCIIILGSMIKSKKVKEHLKCVKETCTDDCWSTFLGKVCNPLPICIPTGIDTECLKNELKKPAENAIKGVSDDIKNYAEGVGNDIKNSTLGVINNIRSELNTINNKVNSLSDNVLSSTNTLVTDMESQVNKELQRITGFITDKVDNIADLFSKLGPVFNTIFETFKEMANVIISTFSFQIETINKMKKCGLVLIKAKPIRTRFRESLAKMFDIALIQLQLVDPTIMYDLGKMANYLSNINKKMNELSTTMVKNISLDWSDFTKLDIKGCIGMDSFMKLGGTYISVMSKLADKIKKLAGNIVNVLEKLADMGVSVSQNLVPININLFGFLKNPWSDAELDASKSEGAELQQLIMEYIAKLTKQTFTDVQQMAMNSKKPDYKTSTFNTSLTT